MVSTSLLSSLLLLLTLTAVNSRDVQRRRDRTRPDVAVKPAQEAKLEIPYDDYAGRRRDPFARGMGRKPPQAVCRFTTKTLLDIVTMTKIVHTACSIISSN